MVSAKRPVDSGESILPGETGVHHRLSASRSTTQHSSGVAITLTVPSPARWQAEQESSQAWSRDTSCTTSQARAHGEERRSFKPSRCFEVGRRSVNHLTMVVVAKEVAKMLTSVTWSLAQGNPVPAPFTIGWIIQPNRDSTPLHWGDLPLGSVPDPVMAVPSPARCTTSSEPAPAPFSSSGSVRTVSIRSDMEEKLSAAKPLTWRGKGDLPQAVWAIPPKGTFLLIELWSGISGLAIAMLSVGFTVYGVAAETDSTTRECAQAVLPHLVHYEAVEQVKAGDFRGLLTRQKPRAVIMGGGSPCQGNSALNSARQGLSDPRSLQPWHLHRLRKEFKDLPEMEGITLILLLENVASMPKQVQEQYDEWLQCSPILIEAGFFGWVHRKRLYWMASEEGSLGVDTPLPKDWSWIPPQGKSPLELRYQGKKPFPSRVVWDHQFTPTFDPSKVMAQGGRGGFSTLSPGNSTTLMTESHPARQKQQNASMLTVEDFHRDPTSHTLCCGVVTIGDNPTPLRDVQPCAFLRQQWCLWTHRLPNVSNSATLSLVMVSISHQSWSSWRCSPICYRPSLSTLLSIQEMACCRLVFKAQCGNLVVWTSGRTF